MKRKEPEPREETSAGSPKKTKTGLHRFVSTLIAGKTKAPVNDDRPVAKEDYYEEFVSASNALRGAAELERQFQNSDPSGRYVTEHASCSRKFYGALGRVLELTPQIDEERQLDIVHRTCHTEPVWRAGHAANLACDRLDDFAKRPRSTLLMNVILFLPYDQPDVQSQALSHLSKALSGDSLGKEHFDAMNYIQSTHPAKIRKRIISLTEKLEPRISASRDGEKSVAGLAVERPSLERLPSEILGKILIHAAGDDFAAKDVTKLKKVSAEIDKIGILSRRIRTAAHASSLIKLSEGLRESCRTAEERFREFMDASRTLSAEEADPNVDIQGVGHGRTRRAFVGRFAKLVASIKFLTEEDQLKTVSEACKHKNLGDKAEAAILACEHLDDFAENPRSNLLVNLIHLTPFGRGDHPEGAFGHLVKANHQGYLKEQHFDAINIVVSTSLPDFGRQLDEDTERLKSMITADPNFNVLLAMIPPLVERDAFRNSGMKIFDEARQTLLNSVRERKTFGRS